MKKIIKLYICIFFIPLSLCYAVEHKEDKKWQLHLELSFVKTGGNTNTETVSLKFDTSRKNLTNKFFLKGNGLYAKTEEEESAARLDIKGRWERMFTEYLFSFITTGFLTDRFSGYEYRINGGPGVGYYLIQKEDKEIKILSSLLFYKDREYMYPFKEDSYTSADLEAFIKVGLTKNLFLKGYVSYSVSLNDREKYFISGDISLEVSINTNISMGIGYQIYYQNKLPDPSVKRLDTTFLTSLIINI